MTLDIYESRPRIGLHGPSQKSRDIDVFSLKPEDCVLFTAKAYAIPWRQKCLSTLGSQAPQNHNVILQNSAEQTSSGHSGVLETEMGAHVSSHPRPPSAVAMETRARAGPAQQWASGYSNFLCTCFLPSHFTCSKGCKSASCQFKFT